MRATTIIAVMARLSAVTARRMRAIADAMNRRVGCAGAQVSPHPDFSGPAAGHSGSAAAGKPRAGTFDTVDHEASARAYLPIGPTCC